jgi:hypothetical protein
LDKVQPNYNSWVGTSVGLFATGKAADFDLFLCKDGFSLLPAIGYSNYYGVEKKDQAVTTNSMNGGWFMISGVELGDGNTKAKKVEVTVSSKAATKLEIWLDDLNTGKPIATIPVTPGSQSKTFSTAIKNSHGRHDVFVKFPKGTQGEIFVQGIRFVGGK